MIESGFPIPTASCAKQTRVEDVPRPDDALALAPGHEGYAMTTAARLAFVVTLVAGVAAGCSAMSPTGVPPSVSAPATTSSPGASPPSIQPQPTSSPSSTGNPPVGPAWVATGPMIEARVEHTATLLADGRLLAAGGVTADSEPAASAERYDAASGTWTATGSLAEARRHHTATLLSDGTVLVAGGNGLGAAESVIAIATAERYNPRSGSWTAAGQMIAGRVNHTATLLSDGTVLVVGGQIADGEGFRRLASAERYDPRTGSWTATASMIGARAYHIAVLLPDGKVLVAGGTSGSGDLASAEVYDPQTASWTAAAQMTVARFRHTATLLPNGSVLVAGGNGPADDRLASAELYDPRSGSWSATATMIVTRSDHVATLLPDGTVLLVGGYRRLDQLVDAAALYYPADGS
jgi:N-acetylneuraminic acid mutarotase